jgi:hypothetical protein
MDKQRLQAIQALELSNDYVKCQKCGNSVPLLRTLTKPRSNRIDALQKQIKWIEEYYHHYRPYGHINNGNNKDNNNNIKQLKQELADLLEEDAKADKLRSLPLYSCRITGWKFVCLRCYDKVYNNILVQRP